MPESRNKSAAPKVAVVVLNWNGYKDTIECIESLKKLTYPNHELLIVDNGSTDGSEGILRERFPELELIQTGRNLGFTGGENAGIRHALSGGADYVALVNNDTVVAPDFIDELVRAAKDDKKAGMLCSKIYFHDRPDVLWYAGAVFHPWIGWGRHRGYDRKDTGEFDRLEETERACGCSVMVSKELCEKAGLLDDDYFCYCEDIDWGLRAIRAGFKVMYVPASRVWHKTSASTGGLVSGISLYYTVRNTLRCVDKNSPLLPGLRHLRHMAIVTTAVLSLFTMDIPKVLGVKRILRGAMDYFQGRFGPFSN